MLARFLGRLRHPYLFAIAAVALVLDLLIPDLIPFVDEILLAAAMTFLALVKKRRADKIEGPDSGEESPQIVDEPARS